jgi:hypothetical protein
MRRVLTGGAVALLAVFLSAAPLAALAGPVQNDAPSGRCFAGAEAPRPPADLPLDHWAYSLIDRLVARRIIQLELTTLPVSRAAVAGALAARRRAEASPDAVAPTEREAWALERLEAEFYRREVDEPTFSLRDRKAVLGLGVLLGTEGRYDRSGETTVEAVDVRSDQSDGEFRASVDVGYELWGGVGDRLGFYSDAVMLLEGQDGPRVSQLSSRARTWRGVAATVDRAYFKYEHPNIAFALGRRDVAWGRSRSGGLLISGTAPTLDGLEASFSVGPLTARALHAFLERPADEDEERLANGEQVFLGAHRVVVSGGWGSVAVSEAVVYSSAIPDPSYLNPLFPYYLSQLNEREDDNVFWTLDFVSRPLPGLELYGEALVDDLQYDRDTGHPDKYGLTLGGHYCGSARGKDYELTGEYANVRKWTYTHHVAEHGLLHDGLPLGFDLGPDADRTRFELVYHPSTLWSVGLTYAFSRLGEGSIEEPFEEGEDDEPAFPSGNVARVHRAGVELSYQSLNGLWATFGAAYELEKDDLIDDDMFELRAAVRFRI